MTSVSREVLAGRLRALPALVPLLERLADLPDVFLVGGAVRDLLLGGEPVDLDLVVDGETADVRSRLGRDAELRVHDRFGTFTARLDGFTYDIARARRERYPRPGALPEVEPAPVDEDLRRRDFSVNAMAISLGGPTPGELRTVAHSEEDLAARRLRVLHDQSFLDDPTRLLRLARYRGRLGFAVEPHTQELAGQALAAGALATVSGPRIGNELRLLCAEADPLAGLSALRELQIDHAIHPWLGLADPELARRGLELLPADGRRDRLALATAAMATPSDELERLLDRLAFEAADREAVVAAATRSRDLARRLQSAESPSQIAAAVDGAGVELVALAGALGPHEQAAAWLGTLRTIELEIAGSDLLAAGVPEGQAVGRGLRAALLAKLDGRATGRDAELAAALEAASSSARR